MTAETGPLSQAGTVESARLLRRLADRQEIHDTLLRYCRGIDRCDRDLIRSAYHDDAHDDHGVFRGGPDEFADWAVAGLRSRNQSTTHVLTNILIEVDGDTAFCESLFTGSHVEDVGEGTVVHEFHGRYLDRFARRGDRWGIVHRRVVYDWTETRHIVRTQAADDPRFLHGERSRRDPSYRRPDGPVFPAGDPE